MGKRALLTLVAALAVTAFSMTGVARAAATPTATPTPAEDVNNVLSVNYYENGGGQVVVSNVSGSNLCANFYVVDETQEMKECCSCFVSDFGTRFITVPDLTSNSFLPTTNGLIAIISGSSTAGACGDPGKVTPAGELAASATHEDSSGLLTETSFNSGSLSDSKTALSSLESQCEDLETVGSGQGICTCGTGS
jgi:hypothetical protein